MKTLPFLILLIALALTGCNTPNEPTPPACDSDGILIAPTATRPTDPDIYVPPTLPNSGDGTVYCPTAVPDETTATTTYPEGFVTAEVVNLSLDSGDQKAEALAQHAQLVIGNGAPLPDSTIILTESHAQGEAMLADRFLSGNALLQENLSLLTRGEGLILTGGDAFFISWS